MLSIVLEQCQRLSVCLPLFRYLYTALRTRYLNSFLRERIMIRHMVEIWLTYSYRIHASEVLKRFVNLLPQNRDSRAVTKVIDFAS